MPTVNVTFFAVRVWLREKRQLADSLTKIVVETLGSPDSEGTVVFRAIAGNDIARGGRFERAH